MPSFGKPSVQKIKSLLVEQQQLPFTHKNVGSTASLPPPGYDVDHTRIKLGHGEQAFRAAKAALQNWTHFRLGWLQAWSPDSSIKVGGMVAVSGRSLGLWWLNVSQIIYLVEDNEPVTRFGFAYGTMPAHMETGEERFLTEWDRRDNTVWYDILAFSRPHGFLARLGYPWLRHLQYRFRHESAAAMASAVSLAERSADQPAIPLPKP